QHELHAGRGPGVAFIIGDLPAPGGVAAAQHNQRRDRLSREQEPHDGGLAIAGERRDSSFQEGADRAIVRCGGAGAALPAGRLECEEIDERGLDCRSFACNLPRDAAIFAEPAQLAAELLELLVWQRALEIARALARGRQQRTLMRREGNALAAATG